MSIKVGPVPKPTESEMSILGVLWAQGPSTVREVHEHLYREDGGGYTTALKLLQIMHGKGLVHRDDTLRAHVFSAAIGKASTQGRFLSDMVDAVFDGSASQLVLHALGSQHASREELDQIRALLDRIEDNGEQP